MARMETIYKRGTKNQRRRPSPKAMSFAQQLSQALQAFYAQWRAPACSHLGAALQKGKGFCTDCGQALRLQWLQLRCRGCGGKRLPKRVGLNHAEPLQAHCPQCGETAVHPVKKDEIQGHEILYSVAIKEIDYSESRLSVSVKINPTSTKTQTSPDQHHSVSPIFQYKPRHFTGDATHVVSGEVVHRWV